MRRRDFLRISGAAALAGACAPRVVVRPGYRRPANLSPVDVSFDRIIRTTVGLRPYRPAGFRVEAVRLDSKTVVHNYGHGGAGMSLSWGTAFLATELAMAHTERRAAVLGCGVAGLTTARQLQRRGFDVTIYAMSLPPDTTSNMSWASFTPTSGLYGPGRRTPEWDAQFRRAVEIAYRELQLLVGPRHGISWIDDYTPTNSPGNTNVAGNGRGGGTSTNPQQQQQQQSASNQLLPANMDLARELLYPGEHPFSTQYARRHPTLRFEPGAYLDTLMRDVIAFGGRIVVRKFDTLGDVAALSENIIINCTGLGSRSLFGDEEMSPTKGQLVILVPQEEVTYMTGSMLPRSDGIALGHVMQRGEWSLDIDEEAQRSVVEEQMRFFGAMRATQRVTPPPRTSAPSEPPPVEAFFGKES